MFPFASDWPWYSQVPVSMILTALILFVAYMVGQAAWRFLKIVTRGISYSLFIVVNGWKVGAPWYWMVWYVMATPLWYPWAFLSEEFFSSHFTCQYTTRGGSTWLGSFKWRISDTLHRGMWAEWVAEDNARAAYCAEQRRLHGPDWDV